MRQLCRNRLPATWIFSDPLRGMTCPCCSGTRRQELYAEEEDVTMKRQRDIARFVATAYVASDACDTLTHLILQCHRSKDMCDVLACSSVTIDKHEWSSLLTVSPVNTPNNDKTSSILEDFVAVAIRLYSQEIYNTVFRLNASVRIFRKDDYDKPTHFYVFACGGYPHHLRDNNKEYDIAKEKEQQLLRLLNDLKGTVKETKEKEETTRRRDKNGKNK